MFRRIHKLQFISKLIRAYLIFFDDVEEYVSLLLYHVLPQSGEKIFLYSHLSFTAAYSLKSEKDWPVDFAKL